MRFFGRKRIVYLVPHLNIAGGIIVVLQHVVRLKRRGYDAYVINVSGEGDAQWFPYADELKIVNLVHEPSRDYKNIDVLIATSWDTFEACETVLPAKKKMYFVQADERGFTDDEGIQNKIDRAYKTDGIYVTEAMWIQRWLKEEYDHDAYYVPNGLDPHIIFKTDPLEQIESKPRILIEGPINVPSKGMDDAYAAVCDLDADLWIVSSNGVPRPEWKYDRFFENVPFTKMNEVFSSCDIFLKMSRNEGFFGPPMEAMACKCAVVVGKVMGYDEYIKNGVNALVVEQGDVSGAREAVAKLIDDKTLRGELISHGEKTAKEWSWDHSVDMLEKAVRGKKIEKFYTNDFPQRYDYKVFNQK